MLKNNFFILALQVIILSVFIMIAAGSGNGLSNQEAYDAGYKIGEGLSTIINN